MRVAINLLTDDPANPSGAHWFWTRVIPEMAKRLTDDEEFHLLVSPRSRPLHEGYGPNVSYITSLVQRAADRCARSASTSTRRSGCRCRGSTSSTR